MAEEYSKNLPQKYLVKTSTTPVEVCELENEATTEVIVEEKNIGNYTVVSDFDAYSPKPNNISSEVTLKSSLSVKPNNLTSEVSIS